MKSVLHIGKYYPPFFGGIENFMAELLPVCHRLGVKQSALVHNTSLKYIVEEIDGVAIYRSSCLGQLMFAPISPLFYFDLDRAIDEQSADVLHIHMPNVSAFWLLFSRKARKLPWVVHWHADVIGERPKWYISLFYPLYRVFEKKLLKRAVKVICTSPNYRDASVALQNLRHKTCVVPLGLPASNSGGNDFKRPIADELNILVVGRLSYYKGHKILFEALSMLSEVEKAKVHVKVVGVGELLAELNEMIRRSGLTTVEMLGRQTAEEIDQLYKWCDLICLPSIEKTEAFGLVILEAARQGKPAIVTDVDGAGMSWVVENNKTGWVVEAGSSLAMKNQISTILQDLDSMVQFGRVANKKFDDCFEIEAVAKDILNLYKQV